MKARIRDRERAGFTLLELLIVIAIIGLLAGMLFPVFKSAQEKGRRVDCMNNLSQFGKALILYSMDHDEHYPSNLVALAEAGYAVNPKMFRCRSDRYRSAAAAISDITRDTADAHCSYNLVTRDDAGVPAGASSPATMLMACDKDGANGNVTAKAFGGNHGGEGGHVLLADGSVTWLNASDWSPQTWGRADVASVAGY